MIFTSALPGVVCIDVERTVPETTDTLPRTTLVLGGWCSFWTTVVFGVLWFVAGKRQEKQLYEKSLKIDVRDLGVTRPRSVPGTRRCTYEVGVWVY